MEHTITHFKRCVLIKLNGRIDSYTAPKLGEAIKSVTDQGHYRIVLDMADVDFLSSAGWWTLINAQKLCKKYNRGEVVVACLNERIRESMNLVGINTYFQLYDDVTPAVANF